MSWYTDELLKFLDTLAQLEFTWTLAHPGEWHTDYVSTDELSFYTKTYSFDKLKGSLMLGLNVDSYEVVWRPVPSPNSSVVRGVTHRLPVHTLTRLLDLAHDLTLEGKLPAQEVQLGR